MKSRRAKSVGKYTLDKAVFRTRHGLLIRPERWAWMPLESNDAVARRIYGCVMRDKAGKLLVPAAKAVLEFAIPSGPLVPVAVPVAVPVTVTTEPVAELPKGRQPNWPRRVQYGRSAPGKVCCVVLKRHNEISLPHWNGGFWSAQLGFVERK